MKFYMNFEIQMEFESFGENLKQVLIAWIIIEFGLNFMKLAVILFLNFLFSVYFFACWQQVFFWILDIKNLVKLRKTINKIRVTASFFVLIFFFVLSQLSQATLRPKLLNFVQKLCPFKRLIYDLILKWRSVGGC